MASKTVALKNVRLIPQGRSGVYATPTGFRLNGASGKVVEPGEAYKSMSKGEARRLRKAARNHGFVKHAAAKRV